MVTLRDQIAAGPRFTPDPSTIGSPCICHTVETKKYGSGWDRDTGLCRDCWRVWAFIVGPRPSEAELGRQVASNIERIRTALGKTR